MGSSRDFGHQYFDDAYGGAYLERNPPGKMRYYVSVIETQVTGGALLDIGCSYGAFVEAALGSFNCRGCDVDAAVVEAAAARVPSAQFFQASLPNVPGESAYDVVTCLDVLEHVPDTAAALDNIRALLRPGGVLCVVVPVYDGPMGAVCRCLDRDETHLHQTSRAWWRNMLPASGFEVLRWDGAIRYSLGRRYIHVAGGWLRRMGPACLYLCRVAEENENGHTGGPGV